MNMDDDLVERFKDKLSTMSDYHGLTGPGLTCYLNSVLQVLFMTPDFREAIQTCCQADMKTIDPYLRELFAQLEKNQARTHDIAATLEIEDVYEQRDAAEYLEKILSLTSPEASKTFRGELSHMTICSRCDDRNEATTYFWVLPLSVEDSHPSYSVDKGLELFFRGQTVSGDNKMFCNRCHKKRDAFIKCELAQTPDVLTLLLKRFHFDSKRMRFIKLHHYVDVTHTLLIKGCTYELYALINHSGNLSGGHYTARIRSFDTGAWYDFNDNTVQLVKQPLCEDRKTSVRSRTPYLLMYKKKRNHPDQSEEEGREVHFAESEKQEVAEEKATPPRHNCPLRDGSWSDAKRNGPESEEREDDRVQAETPQKSKLTKTETRTKSKSCMKSKEESPIKSPRGSEESFPKRSHDSRKNRRNTEGRSTSGTRRDRNVTETVADVERHRVSSRETRLLSSLNPESKHRHQPLEGASKGTTTRKDRRPENTHRGAWRS